MVFAKMFEMAQIPHGFEQSAGIYTRVCVCVHMCAHTFSVQKRFSWDFLAALCVSVAIVFKKLFLPV